MNLVLENWDEIIQRLKIEHGLSDVSFKTWIAPLEVYKVEDSVVFKKVYIGSNCYIKNCIILNDVHIGDNTHLENCIVESRDTIRANTEYIGQNGEIKIVVEKNDRFPM